MILRLTAAFLAAGTTCSLATADVAAPSNPKTRPIAYTRAAQKLSSDELAAQKKLERLAQLKQSGGSSSATSQGGFQQGQPLGQPGILTLNGSDNCATPDPISGTGTFFFDNSAATTGTQGQNETLCLAFAHTAIAHDVWFVWTAPSTGTASMTLCGTTGMDSKIAAYAGSSCPLPGTALACNDDSCGVQSSMSFPVTAGSNYMLQLGNYYNAAGASGTFALNVLTSGPSNDQCANAIAVSGAGPFAFDTTGATTSPQQSGTCGTSGQDIWYQWTAYATGAATLDLCGSSFDSIVAVYPTSGCPSGSTLWCNDDSCGLQSQVTFPCTAGNSYMFQIGGYNANSGPGAFSVNVIGGGPANDDCAGAVPITGAGPFSFDSTGATTSSQQLGACGVVGQDVWFDWTAPSTGLATLALCGTSYDTVASVYAGGGCPAGAPSWCNDDGCGVQSSINFGCVAGQVYTLQIGGYGINSGPGTFTLNVGAGAPNDDCSAATAIAGNGTFPFDSTLATTGSAGQTEALCLSFATTAIDNDVWFAWTAPSSGTATFSICGLGGGIDSKIAVYAGSSCPVAGSAIACNDDSCVYESELTFPATGGSTYLLQLGSFPGSAGAAGSFSINVGGGGGPTYICDPGAGGVMACPCANPPAGSGRGCDNSSITGGASITGAGSSTLASPTLAFTTAGEKPTATSILLQGGTSVAAGVAFGQGVRCAGGPLKRLYAKPAVGGSITAPNFGAGDADIPARSAFLGDPIAAGTTRWYMVYYRDPVVLGGCSGFATFNCTNTAEVLWQ